MSFEDLEPRPVKKQLLTPADMEPHSIKELQSYIAQLKGEIVRAEEAISAKRDLRGDAEALFKS
ncbi:MAG: DUF1192 domain-containing protein [Alphaproteobacteria bacterium]